eukprot:12699456-Alexandrium_andersonii.AAC.1
MWWLPRSSQLPNLIVDFILWPGVALTMRSASPKRRSRRRTVACAFGAGRAQRPPFGSSFNPCRGRAWPWGWAERSLCVPGRSRKPVACSRTSVLAPQERL